MHKILLLLVNWLCVCSTRFSAAEKNVLVLDSELWSIVCIVQQQQKELRISWDFWLGIPILKCWFLDTISFSTNTYAPHGSLKRNHRLNRLSKCSLILERNSDYMFYDKFNEHNENLFFIWYFHTSHTYKKFIILNSIIW